MLVWGDDDDVAISVSCYTCAIPVVLKNSMMIVWGGDDDDDADLAMLWVSQVAMQPDYKGPEVTLVERIMQLQTLGVRCLECGNACLVPPCQFMHFATMLKVEDLLLSCVCVFWFAGRCVRGISIRWLSLLLGKPLWWAVNGSSMSIWSSIVYLLCFCCFPESSTNSILSTEHPLFCPIELVHDFHHL